MAALSQRALPPARVATLRRLRDRAGHIIDRELVLWFPAPDSFTGEDVCELHVHGGRAVLDAIFAALQDMSGVRPAEPGEFTRRAVGNGKFDLTAAEGLADLIAAETPVQHRQAMRQFEGALATVYEDWRRVLMQQLVVIETAIDFSDEELPSGIVERSVAQLAEVQRAMRAHGDDHRRGEMVRDGIQVALIGPPNAGKSSLLNALAGRDVAIVSELAGTTRDVIEVRLDLGGYPVVLFDTAGLHSGRDEIEREGIRRALERARSADIVVLVLDGETSQIPVLDFAWHFTVWNKSDQFDRGSGPNYVSVSAKTGHSMDKFEQALTGLARGMIDEDSELVPLTRARHRAALAEAVEALDRAAVVSQDQLEILAENVRLALRSVGRITGYVDIEEVLDLVFSEFCIGK